jgi:cell division septation protein DedD
MKPLLLDQRSILKAGMTLVFSMFLVFCTGFYIGTQHPGFTREAGLNTTIALALPSPAHADTAELELQLPPSQSPGADIDVDSPDVDGNAQHNEVPAAVQPGLTVSQLEAGLPGEAAADDDKAQQQRSQLKLASLTVPAALFSPDDQAAIIEQQRGERAAVGDAPASLSRPDPGRFPAIVDTATVDDARYTIQVGVFADSDNAVRRVEELETLHLSAYTQGYANKRNQLRFNVRFGYFRDKASAVAALNRFEKDLSGTGYITRIRPD